MFLEPQCNFQDLIPFQILFIDLFNYRMFKLHLDHQYHSSYKQSNRYQVILLIIKWFIIISTPYSLMNILFNRAGLSAKQHKADKNQQLRSASYLISPKVRAYHRISQALFCIFQWEEIYRLSRMNRSIQLKTLLFTIEYNYLKYWFITNIRHLQGIQDPLN